MLKESESNYVKATGIKSGVGYKKPSWLLAQDFIKDIWSVYNHPHRHIQILQGKWGMRPRDEEEKQSSFRRKHHPHNRSSTQQTLGHLLGTRHTTRLWVFGSGQGR